MKYMRIERFDSYEETRSYNFDEGYFTFEESYTSAYGLAASYDSFVGMRDELFDQMQMSFAINVSVACF